MDDPHDCPSRPRMGVDAIEQVSINAREWTNPRIAIADDLLVSAL